MYRFAVFWPFSVSAHSHSLMISSTSTINNQFQFLLVYIIPGIYLYSSYKIVDEAGAHNLKTFIYVQHYE